MRPATWFEKTFFKRRLADFAAAEAEAIVLGERLRAAETTVVEQSATLRDLKYTMRTAEEFASKAREQADALVATNYRLRRQHELAASFNCNVNGKHECCPCVKDLQKYSQDALAVSGLTYRGLIESVAKSMATEQSPSAKDFEHDDAPVATGLDEKRPGLPAVKYIKKESK